MNAAETIQGAIEKLTVQRTTAVAGPWRIDGPDLHFGSSGDPNDCEATSLVSGTLDRHPVMHGANVRNFGSTVGAAQVNANADLIVTLHATIDAQLLIMRNELEEIEIDKEASGFARPPHHDVFTLARAILGEQATDD